ncbi:SUKH-4 family immunity protein [Streptomyces sp. NRRL B-24484]|uniref:SUKH-4 family immunity protein n=1 Tax=Streptomyces sp. NRRL B-24484 TaxID=1463833 RepID=UPI0004C18CE4|nr:SUKH-4 family immunity protein [Streptomyces sp. NRRL B-24484]
MDIPAIVDCDGLHVDEVQARALRAVQEGGASSVRLEGVGSAGPLISSAEPGRIEEWARRAKAVLGVGVEIAPEVPFGPVVDEMTAQGPLDRVLSAASGALELRRSPLVVWRAVVAALAGPVDDEELQEAVERHPLLVRDGGDIGFARVHVHREVRRSFPLSADQQRAVHRAVLGLREEPAAAGYLRAARPVHAALAGELGEWLADPDFLVESGWYGLALGLALAYPEGVPLGTVAGDLHCVLLEGVAAPASHEEWLSWVHHTLVGRGFTAAADEVATRVRLPWQTLWSHWRWPSGYAPRTPAETEQDRILLVHGPGGPTLATRHEPWDGHSTVYEQLWNFRTGEKLGGVDTEVHENVLPREKDLSGRTALHMDGEWSSAGLGRQYEEAAELPWAGESVVHAVQCTPSDPADGTTWVFMGRCGLFGAVVHEDLMARLPRLPRGGPGRPLSGRARWPRPEVSFDGPLGREELEQDWAFGRGACRPVPPEGLPVAVEHGATREFLSEVGWPVADHPGLLTPELAPDGLVPADGRPGLLTGLGRFFGSPILLDGRTGEVFGEDWNRDLVLVAGGLPQFLRIVMVHRAVLQVPVLLGVDDSFNLEEDVLGWIGTIDPAAAEAGFWEQKYFAPTLLDLWEETPE